MSEKTDIPNKGHQADVAADRYRSELISALQELDRRRGEAMDMRLQVQKHKGQLIAVVAVIGGVAALGIGFAIIRSREEKARLRRERVRGFIRAWENPKRLASKAPDRPMPAELARKFVLVFATALISNYAKKSANAVIEGARARQLPA